MKRQTIHQHKISASSWVWAGVVVFMVFSFAPRANSGWFSAGTLNLPAYNYSFLAATPSGDLIAVTFNSMGLSEPPREIPALLIKDPTGPAPQVIELCRIAFSPQRGYSGLASCFDGSFFVSGDTGDPATSFIRKFRADGSPDTTFAAGGELKPNRRCLGIDVIGQYLLVAMDWADIKTLDVNTGEIKGSLPKPPEGTVYVRDIAIDPRTMEVFGVAEGSVVMWEGGAPWNPEAYTFRRLTQPAGKLRAGEGISIDPLNRAALILPVPGNKMLSITADGKTLETVVSSALPTTDLTDSVLSFDGNTLFISDMVGKKVHILRRAAGADVASAATPPAAAVPAAPASASGAAVAKTQWTRSYLESVEQASARRQPMVVYFRQDGIQKCVDFENNVLLSSEFDRRAQGFVCVFEDLAVNRLFAYRFGVFRIPHVVVLDANKNIQGVFTFDIRPEDLFSAMDRARAIR